MRIPATASRHDLMDVSDLEHLVRLGVLIQPVAAVLTLSSIPLPDGGDTFSACCGLLAVGLRFHAPLGSRLREHARSRR
jgi:hypothetical protein